MTGVATLWIAGIACLIVALVGKAIKIGGFVELPETAGKKVRAGMAVVGMIALALGAVLLLHSNGSQQPQATATSGTIPAPRTSELAPESPAATSQAAITAPSASPAGSKAPAVAQKPLYLDTLNGTIDGTIQGESAAPETSSWILGTRTYPHSLGYTADNNLCDPYLSVTYVIPGSYQYLVATVGVSDIQTDSSGQGVVVSFEVDDSSGDQLGTQSAEYGKPGQMRIPIQGVTSLTLKTSSSLGCFGGGSTEAVWGDAELLP